MQDDKLKDLLSGSGMKASENLKFRIMHQIEAEKSLSRKEKPDIRPFISNMFSIFGVMYLLIVILALAVYFMGGKSALESVVFFIPVILIASVCAVFWLISSYDDRRQSKQKTR